MYLLSLDGKTVTVTCKVPESIWHFICIIRNKHHGARVEAGRPWTPCWSLLWGLRMCACVRMYLCACTCVHVTSVYVSCIYACVCTRVCICMCALLQPAAHITHLQRGPKMREADPGDKQDSHGSRSQSHSPVTELLKMHQPNGSPPPSTNCSWAHS